MLILNNKTLFVFKIFICFIFFYMLLFLKLLEIKKWILLLGFQRFFFLLFSNVSSKISINIFIVSNFYEYEIILIRLIYQVSST
jgi:hypothetical protein